MHTVGGADITQVGQAFQPTLPFASQPDEPVAPVGVTIIFNKVQDENELPNLSKFLEGRRHCLFICTVGTDRQMVHTNLPPESSVRFSK